MEPEVIPVRGSPSNDVSIFREAMLEARVGAWVYDLIDGTVSLDARSAKAFGMPKCAPYAEFLGRFPPDHRARIVGAVARAVRPEGSGRFKFTCALPCIGNPKWIQATGRCTFESVGRDRRPVRMTGAIQDVTHLKRTETALREREAWLDLALEAGGIGTFSYEAGGPARCSAAYRRLFHFGPDEEITESRFIERVHPEDRETLSQLIRLMEREERARLVHEYRIVLPDGQVRWIDATTRVFKERGRPLRVIGIVRDITHRKEAERALRTAHDRMNLANEAAEIGTWDWELAAGIIQLDQRAQRMMGVEGHAVIDYPLVRSRMHPEDWEHVDAAVLRAASSTQPAMYSEDFRIIHPDGTTRWMSVKGRTQIEAGKAVRFVGVGVDITERKVAEERLARLATIVEASDDFIGTADAQGRTIYLNSAARRLLGCETASDLHHILVTDYHPQWAKERIQESLGHAARAGSWLGESVLRAADGREIPVSQRIVAHRNDKGEVVLYSTIARDISERKNYERSLSDADRQKDEFLAVLGHELRNPLATIGNAIELLKLQREDPAEIQHLIDVMDRQTGHMSRLLDDLLDVSRITRGKIELETRRIDMRTVVRDVTSDLRDAFIREGLALETEITEKPLEISGDSVRMAQIVSNLLDNARKFTDAPGRVTVHAYRQESSAVLEVEDTGIGFDPTMIERLFVPFQQGPRARSKAGGLGLGLALVKGLVELHGGSVEASTKPDRGARFRVRLPLCTSQADSNDRGPESEAPKQRHRLLVVDDNRDSADMMSKALELLGHEVAVAYDGPEAIEAARRFHPDTVFCDIGLPGAMTGYDVARALRQELGAARLIAVTGYGRPEDREAARRAGFDRHLTKPVKLAHLEEVLSQARP